MQPVALTIAGSDPSGGAGIQADLKTFCRFGVYGEAVITLLTVQNTQRVSRVDIAAAGLVLEQIDAVIQDIPPNCAKTGALGNSEIVLAVAERARTFDFPLIVDPVMISKHGATLISGDAIEAIRRHLLPCAYLITPNLAEASALTGREVSNAGQMSDAARALCGMGASGALIKGGHLDGAPLDVLCFEDRIVEFTAERVNTSHTHGTGCTYSAAITAGIACGKDPLTAIADAKVFVTAAILTNPGLGHGVGPLNHWA